MRLWLKFLPLGWLILSCAYSAQPPVPIEEPPMPPSPLDEFRQWLRMPPEQREKQLQEWPDDKRAVLRDKVRAYQQLDPAESERRLRMLELRWYLRPLMSAPTPQRESLLKRVPLRLQPLVTRRLKEWDMLTPKTQKEILENDEARELVTRYFTQLQQGRALQPAQRADLEKSLAIWTDKNPAERKKLTDRLASFFELPREQQGRALDALSEPERQEIQKTLDAFAQLSPEQRRICVDSFQKFATMTPPERALFLRNAARWQAMTQQERDTWKDLVTKLPPLPTEPLESPPTPNVSAPSTPSVARTTSR